jgi:putative component of toxin-antitoxin plasmid stabilization module
MLAYVRSEVHELNQQARELRRTAGELGRGQKIMTEGGEREFASGDRVYFLRNERSLDVKNGSLGTVEAVEGGVLQVRMDSEEGRRIAVDSRYYPHLEHGYAATTHKNQGTTVDRAYVLATAHFDRHSTYVAMTRHRHEATIFYGKDDFQPDWRPGPAEENLLSVLSRARPKELAHDYLERDETGRYTDPRDSDPGASIGSRDTTASPSAPKSQPNAYMSAIDALQQRGAELWRALQLAKEAESRNQNSLNPENDLHLDPTASAQQEIQKHPSLKHPGKEQEFEP